MKPKSAPGGKPNRTASMMASKAEKRRNDKVPRTATAPGVKPASGKSSGTLTRAKPRLKLQGKTTTKTTRKAKPGPKRAQAPEVPRETPDLVVDDRLLIPQKLCALVFNVTPQAIQQWAIKPRMRRGRESLYYLPDLSRFRDHQVEKETGLNLNTERARLAHLQAEGAELDLEERRGNLIPAEVILENWEPIIGAARAKVLSIPNKLKDAIPKLTEKDLAKIRKVARGVLEDLANGGISARASKGTRASL